MDHSYCAYLKRYWVLQQEPHWCKKLVSFLEECVTFPHLNITEVCISQIMHSKFNFMPCNFSKMCNVIFPSVFISTKYSGLISYFLVSYHLVFLMLTKLTLISFHAVCRFLFILNFRKRTKLIEWVASEDGVGLDRKRLWPQWHTEQFHHFCWAIQDIKPTVSPWGTNSRCTVSLMQKKKWQAFLSILNSGIGNCWVFHWKPVSHRQISKSQRWW